MVALSDAVTFGRLPNGNDCPKTGTCVTDSSANIAKYLGSLEEATLFADQCVFRKVE